MREFLDEVGQNIPEFKESIAENEREDKCSNKKKQKTCRRYFDDDDDNTDADDDDDAGTLSVSCV